MSNLRALLQPSVQVLPPMDPQRSSVKFVLDQLEEPTPHNRAKRMTQSRMATERNVARLQELEARQRHMYPAVDPVLEAQITQARFERSIFYWILFRFHDLLPEIILNIFRFVVWGSNNRGQAIGQRLCLTWVCREWRQIMLSDPTIWNAVFITDPYPFNRSLAFINRAGSSVLDIKIDQHDKDWGNSEDEHRFRTEHMTMLMDYLWPRITQIRILAVVVDNWPPALVVLHKLQAAGRAGIPIRMHHFELHRIGRPFVWLGGGYQPNEHRNPTVLFGGTNPYLRHIALDSVFVDWTRSPLSNLTTLDLRRIALQDCPTPDRFMEILRNSPFLEKLVLDGAGPQPSRPTRAFPPPVELFRLKALAIGHVSSQYADYIIRFFTAPNVVDLTLMDLNGQDYNAYTSFFAILAPMIKHVKILTLYTVVMQRPAVSTVAKFYNAMPQLRYLKVARIPEFLLALLNDDASTYLAQDNIFQRKEGPLILCPKLSIIEFQALEVSIITSFVEGRKVRGLPIDRVYVNEGEWYEKFGRTKLGPLNAVATTVVLARGAMTSEEYQFTGWS